KGAPMLPCATGGASSRRPQGSGTRAPRQRRNGILAVAIDLKQQQPSGGGGLEPLTRLVEADLRRVNEIIIEKMQSPVALIPQLAGHIIAAGGKRLRPMLTLASARLCEAEGERQMALAACVEFIHTATLLQHDVVDASELRRGLQTAN